MAKQTIYTKLFNILLILAVGYFIVSCANPVTPTGGPKDEDPPEALKSEPPQFSRNFTSEKVKITFNEFIELKDVLSEVIISPPMDKMPDFKIKGKSLVIEFNEELKEQTTYNIFMGNSVVDLTENNPYENFQYVFSTGDHVDSLSVIGNVKKAFDLTSVENVNVMLYLDINDTIEFDSLPYYVKPYYLTKTNEAGDFTLNNLADKQYKLFALIDLNGNMIYDQPTEEIAFIDSLIKPQFDPPTILDTASVADTLIEVIIESDLPDLIPNEMSLFQEVDSVQKFLKAYLSKNYQLIFYFKRPVTDLNIRPLNLNEELDWAIIEPYKTQDTLTYWLKNINQDSLILEISDAGIILDTTEIAVVKRAIGRKEKKEEEKEEPERLTVKYNIKKQNIDLNQPLILTFDYPIELYDFQSISLFENDTVPVVPQVEFIDSSIQRKLAIKYSWKQGTAYSMIIPDSIFFNIHGNSHDTLGTIFISKILEDYGNIYLTTSLLNTGKNHIIQLLSKENIIHEMIITENQRISYEYLNPGNYRIKVIYDQNNNGTWDSGDYFYNIQPEIVGFFPTQITVRANWDIEEEWEL